LLYHWATLE